MNKTVTKILAAIVLSASTPVFSQWTNTNCTGSGTTYDMTTAGGKLLVARGNSGVISTTDGTTWATENVGTTGSFRSMKNFGGTLYSSTNGSSLFTSTDNGSSWTSLPGKSGLVSVQSSSVYKNGSVLIYGTNSGSASTYYSTNGGSTWSTSQFNYGSGLQQGFEAAQYDIVELNGDLYFASLNDLFKSTDQGATWSVVTTAPNISNGTVTSLCAINGGLLLTIYGGGVHRSLDGGNTWTMVLGGPLGTLTNNMTRAYYEYSTAFVGGAVGQVYMSSDNGATWTDISETGINTGDVVQSIKIFSGNVYIGTNTNVYKRVLTGVGINEHETAFFSVYPNPANDVLHVNLSDNRETAIQMFDVLGKQVFIKETNGQSQDKIDLSFLPKGIYFLRINNKTEKIIKN
ncbi:MAG: T9SS type A sorting domain-containing protein [Bacteroidia bacterium]|nr:T9SS type A sorting domain-containing protein [Bacteroidia bacterium]